MPIETVRRFENYFQTRKFDSVERRVEKTESREGSGVDTGESKEKHTSYLYVSIRPGRKETPTMTRTEKVSEFRPLQ